MKARLSLPWCFKKYQKKLPYIRSLTIQEVQLVQRVFGGLIDEMQVKIVNYPYVPWQLEDVMMAPNGWIFVTQKHYKDDYTKHGSRYQQIFIHEMTHVFQHQQGINVLVKGAWLQLLYYLSFKKYDPYRYFLRTDKGFWEYNIEQQGRLCEDILLGNAPNIICPKTTSVESP